ncbi:hypothetical protein T11_10586, partial [Trichinella zimbabwensis]
LIGIHESCLKILEQQTNYGTLILSYIVVIGYVT